MLVKYVGEKKYVGEEFSVCWWSCMLVKTEIYMYVGEKYAREKI